MTSFSNSTSTQPLDMATLGFLSKIFPGGDGNIFTTNQCFNYISPIKLDPDDANYYAICKVKDKSDNKLTRKNDDFVSLNILVCDDIGTKASPPPLEPSYIIETSSGNFQWGYRLDEPVTDIGKANALIKALIKSGYTDEGAGSIVRLVRTPSGTNLKKDGFKVRLVSPFEDLDKTYSYDVLLNMVLGGTQNSPKPTSNSSYVPYIEPMFIPESSRNTELTKYCGSLFGQGLDSIDVLQKMYIKNAQACSPPLPQKEVETIYNSIHEAHHSKINSIINNLVFITEDNEFIDISNKSKSSPASLNTQYLKDFPGVKGKASLITKWLPKQVGFRQVQTTGWIPAPYGSSVHDVFVQDKKNVVNAWKGWQVEPVKGDIQPYLDHLAHVIPEVEYRQVFLEYIAFIVQYTHLKCNWHPVITGVSGAGKDALFRPLFEMLGSAAATVGNKEIKSAYDDEFYETKLVVGNEVLGLSEDHWEEYKRKMASESGAFYSLNIKSRGKRIQKNLWAMPIISNNLDAVKFNEDERRVFIVHAPSEMTEEQRITYFDNWLDVGGASALMYYLLNEVDLSKFDRNSCVKTTYFYKMLEATRTDFDAAIQDAAYTRKGSFAYELIFPEYLRNELNVNCTIKDVAAWLKDNGYATFSNIRIQKANETIKSALWCYKVGGKFDPTIHKISPTKLWMEVDAIETIVLAIQRSGQKY